ncbi:T9SS type A sorting domain-containing protein [candidate division KSB1 bacterium]|nr:T9SS type A sorting domain-containing protein [candidate division KSB1 bacterium]
MNRVTAVVVLCGLICTPVLLGQVDPALDARLEKRSHSYNGTERPYRLFVPDNYSPSVQYPLLLFLHGARWAGTDNITQLDNELAVYWVADSLQNRTPSFVVWPQIPAGVSWEKVSGQVSEFPDNPELALVNDLLDSLVREFSIDTHRLYICGKSIGGSGVYGMLARYPKFAAAVPVAGMYVYKKPADLLLTPLWILHAKFDNVISIEQSRHVAGRLEALGRQVVLTHCDYHTDMCGQMSDADVLQQIQGGARFVFSEFDTSGHQIEPRVVKTFGLGRWVFAQKKNDTKVRLNPVPETYKLSLPWPNPFNHATRIQYFLPVRDCISLDVYDILGKHVATLSQGEQAAGNHSVTWQDRGAASGMYFFCLQTGSGLQQWRKASLVK